MKKENIIDMSIKNRNAQQNRFESILELASLRIDGARKLCREITRKENMETNYDMIHSAKMNYIISMVSALEVCLKDFFIGLIDLDAFTYEHLDFKYDLKIIKMLLDREISVGFLIAEEYNFQNLDLIFKAFSRSLKINLLILLILISKVKIILRKSKITA